MQNPATAYRVKAPKDSSSRYIGIAFVGAIHVVIIAALVSGLAKRIVTEAPRVLQTTVIQPETKKPEPAEKLPQPAKPAVEMPKADTVPPPEIDIQTPPADAAPQAVTEAETAPAAVDAPAAAVTGTHTIPPYPPTARRLGHQGRVELQLTIDTDGHVTNAVVTKSSGFAELDSAAVDWVVGHWRYKPAMKGGVPVVSTALAAVKFDLRSAR